MRNILVPLSLLACTACAAPAPDAVSGGAQQDADTACRDYQLPIIIGNQQQQATRHACPQPDGSWQLTEETPGMPTQTYWVPPPGKTGAAEPMPTPLSTSAQPSAGQPNCREFTMPVVVEGEERQAVGQACQQADGSWRVTQQTPGLPTQAYLLPPPVYYPAPYPYPDYAWDPWAYGPPFGFGASFLFIDHFHHHHRFHHARGFHGRNFQMGGHHGRR
jgi:hypothetical protein